MAAAPPIFLRPDPMDLAVPAGTWLLRADGHRKGPAGDRLSFTQGVVLAILLSLLPWGVIILIALAFVI
jgi:hypothetical protein